MPAVPNAEMKPHSLPVDVTKVEIFTGSVRMSVVRNSDSKNSVYEKMKQEMRISGIKSIPRGIRKTTQENPALLTDRELDVLNCLHKGLQNKEIAGKLFISAKTVDHHISAILYKLEAKSRVKAVQEAVRMGIIK